MLPTALPQAPHFQRFSRSFLAVALSTFTLLPLHAAETNSAPNEAAAAVQPQPETLPEVVVTAEGRVAKASRAATKTDIPLVLTPQAVSVVSQEEIRLRGAQNVTEALNYTPGLLTGAAQGEDSRVDDIVIRGFDVSGFTNNQYLDGLRVANGGQWTRSQFDIFGLERVEVLKGPSAVLYGQVTPGGLLNQVSKRPTAENRGLVSLRYGSFGTWQQAADVSGPLDSQGKVLYRLVGLHREGGSQVDHTDLERNLIAPSLTWNLDENTHLTVMASFQEDRGGATYQFLPVNGTLFPTSQGTIPRGTFIGEPDFNTFNRRQFTVGYEFEHKFNDHLTLVQNFRYENVETFYESVVAGRSQPNAAGMMARRAVRGIGEAMNVAVDTRLQARFQTGPVDHTLVGGMDILYSEWDHLRVGTPNAPANIVPPINVYDPQYTGFRRIFTKQVEQDVKERQLGFYLQEQLVWQGWHLTLGGRYDRARNDLTNVMTGARTVTDSEAFTGRVALLHDFKMGLAPYLSYATSFEPVSGTDVNGNVFDPSEGEQFEIGLKYEPKGWNALFTLSAFQLTQQNVLTLDPANPPFQIQTGEIEIRGIEFESKVDLKHGFALYGGVAWLDSEITRSNDGFAGNYVMNAPDFTGSLWLDYTVPSGPLAGLGAGAGIRYVSQRYGDNGNAYHLPSYTLWDMAVRYDLRRIHPALRGTSLALRINNIADKTYLAKASAATAANYGPGREFSLTLSHTW